MKDPLSIMDELQPEQPAGKVPIMELLDYTKNAYSVSATRARTLLSNCTTRIILKEWSNGRARS